MRVTERQIKKLLHESNLIEGYDRADFDAQSLLAWNKLIELDIKSLTKGDICKTQKIITLLQTDLRPDWRGYYRKIDVWVASRKGVDPDLIDDSMRLWVNHVRHGFISPENCHIEFEKIHPFVDGNGRTGRMLMWWQQLKLEQPLTELRAADRQEYYKWFR